MQQTFDLTYDKLAYWQGNNKLICSDALQTRAPNVRLTISNEPLAFGNAIEVPLNKTESGWKWPREGKYPFILYDWALDLMNHTFYPDAQVGDTVSIWLLLEIL